ncbi:MAG: hypothetical protein ACYDD7_23200, partial [Acidimicrobiales bacterium]
MNGVIVLAAEAAKRDLLTTLTDVATVAVGIAAIIALLMSAYTIRVERARIAEAGERERARADEAWNRQLILDHHARIYAATADVMMAVTRIAVVLDKVPDGNLNAVVAEFDSLSPEARNAIDRLWFLLPATGDGRRLLEDLELLRNLIGAMAPESVTHPAGVGDIEHILEESGLRDDIHGLVSTDSLGPDSPERRMAFLVDYALKYLRSEIGRYVQPPPLASPPPK